MRPQVPSGVGVGLAVLIAMALGVGLVADEGAPPPTRGKTTAVTTYRVPSSAGPFRPSDVWFINQAEGWVIGEAGCDDGECTTTVLRTRDGGRHWETTGAPATAGETQPGRSIEYVISVRFADARNGWAFDRELWATHDGGASWHEVHLGNPVLAVEATAGRAYAVVGSCGQSLAECTGPIRIFQTPVGADDWRSVLEIEMPPPHNGGFIVAGRVVYFVVDTGGMMEKEDEPPLLYRLPSGGRWQRRTLPPSCDWGAFLAPITADDLFVACKTGEGVASQAPHDFHESADGGKSWRMTWKSERSPYFGPIAITSQGRFVVTHSERLEIQRPDGSHESIRFTASGSYAEGIRSLRFPTLRFGVVLTGEFLYVSRDAGHTWEPVHFPL